MITFPRCNGELVFEKIMFCMIIFILLGTTIVSTQNFQNETISPNVPSISESVATKVDSVGNIHILFRSSSDSSLIYGIKDETGWHTEVVENSDVGVNPSLAIDSENNPHIAYKVQSFRWISYGNEICV